MRHLTAAFTFLLLAALVLPAQAAEVAMLDWRQALMDTDAAQRSMSQLETRIESQQQEAQSLSQKLQQLQEQIQQMPEGDRESALQEFQQQGARFEWLRQQIAQAQQEAEQKFLQDAEPKLDQAVQQIIDRHAIEVLVEPQGVLHASRDLPDMTGEVTQILNSLF
jgi:outer membrane protein